MNKDIIIALIPKEQISRPCQYGVSVPCFEDCPRPHTQVVTTRLIARDDFAMYNCLESFKSYVNMYVLEKCPKNTTAKLPTELDEIRMIQSYEI